MVKLSIALSENFFEKENRNGYHISKKMKEVWAVELDLLNQLDIICKKYGIQYFASGGTMLGAVRHKGFIPWDDDIDIMMMRGEYEKLCSHASEFSEPYFFQTGDSDIEYFTGHAQLRNSNTTAILECNLPLDRKFNQGIFIDIFPLDAVPDSEKLLNRQIIKIQKYLEQTKWLYSRTDGYDSENSSWKRKLMHPMLNLISKFYSYRDCYHRFEKACKKYNHLNTKYVSKLSFHPEDKKLFNERRDFDHVILMNFEEMKIPVSYRYHEILSYKYGDYMTFKRGINYHGGIIFDPDLSYRDWITHHSSKNANSHL